MRSRRYGDQLQKEKATMKTFEDVFFDLLISRIDVMKKALAIESDPDVIEKMLDEEIKTTITLAEQVYWRSN